MEGVKIQVKLLNRIVNGLFQEIAAATCKEGEVGIRDFGTFRRVERSYRIGGREGRTAVIRFKPGKGFKEKC